MIVPLCPMCGHEMYFVGLIDSVWNTVAVKRYACIHCNHVEDMIQVEGQDKEVLG